MWRWARRLWILAFMVLEGAALARRGTGDTLTEQLRPWIQGHPVRVLLVGAGIIWLFYHFLIEE
jgi:hypothetical protein